VGHADDVEVARGERTAAVRERGSVGVNEIGEGDDAVVDATGQRGEEVPQRGGNERRVRDPQIAPRTAWPSGSSTATG
jgi:hypothetical protein